MGTIKNFWRKIRAESKEHKSTFRTYRVLRLLVAALFAFSLLRRNYETAFFCALTLVLFWLPFLLQDSLRVELPAALEITILLFIFSAEILGEAGGFYVHIPVWDTLLHTVNGFLCAAIGFSLIDLLNRGNRFRGTLSPAFVAAVAFCFSMTIGVIWEFFEFLMDSLFSLDMQKDFLVGSIHSVLLDESRQNIAIHIENIAKTVLYDAEGNEIGVIEGGFLDIGNIDTMKDLLVNFLGAFVFSLFGYFYVRNRGKGKIVKRFIPGIKA